MLAQNRSNPSNKEHHYNSTQSAQVGVNDTSTSETFDPGGEQTMIVNEAENEDDPLQVLSFLADYNVEKFDSGASRCMTGDPTRLVN